MCKPDRPFDPLTLPALHGYLEGARSISDAFDIYRAHIMPKSAGPNQVVETRRAFFAGADWIYKRIMASVDDEDDAAQLLEGFARELDDYAQAIIERGS